MSEKREEVVNQVLRRAPVLEMSARQSARPGERAIQTETVSVVFTSVEDTVEAARVAADLARALRVPLQLIHFRTVSPHVPVNEPGGSSPLEADAFIARLRREGISAAVRIYLCRDVTRTIPWAFRPRSIVVMGGHRSWWPTRVERLRHALEKAGHFVVFVPSPDKEPSHA